MSELRRLKMKIGDAEFEAEVHPMYDQFLSMLRQRTHTPERAFAGEGGPGPRVRLSQDGPRERFTSIFSFVRSARVAARRRRDRVQRNQKRNS